MLFRNLTLQSDAENWYEFQFDIVTSIFSTLSLIFGIYTILLIIFKTSAKTRRVRKFLIFLQSCLISMDVHNFLIKPMIFIPTTAVAFLGWFEEFGVSYKVQAYLIQVHYVWIALCILILFKDRYDCIVHQNPNRKHKTIYYLANLLFGCLILCPIYMQNIDNDLEKSKILAKHPNMPPRFFASQTHIVTTRITLACCLVCFEIMLIIVQLLYFTCSTIHFLRKKSSNLSDETRKMQLHTVFSLILQTIIPICVVALPVIFNSFLIFLEIYIQVFNIFTLAILLCHGLFSSLCIIYNHQPYREYTKHLIFFFKKSRIDNFQNQCRNNFSRGPCAFEHRRSVMAEQPTRPP